MSEKFKDDSYCEKCYDSCLAEGKMDIMVRGSDVHSLVDYALNYYKTANFAILSRGSSDHDFELAICTHRDYEKIEETKYEDIFQFMQDKCCLEKSMIIVTKENIVCPVCQSKNIDFAYKTHMYVCNDCRNCGDCVSFVAKTLKISPIQAIAWLVKEHNIEIPEYLLSNLGLRAADIQYHAVK